MTARQVAARLFVAFALATPGIALSPAPQALRATLLQSAAADDASSAETPVAGDVTDGDHGGGDAEKPPRSEENVDVPAEEPGTNPTTPTDPPVVDPPSEEPPAEDPTEPVPPVDDPDGEKPHDDDPAPIGPGNGGGPTIPPSNPGGPILGPTDPAEPVQGPSLPAASPVSDVFDALAWPLGSGVTTPRSRRVLGMTATSEPQHAKPATVQQLDESTGGSVSLNVLRAEVLDAQYFRSRGAPRPTGPLRVAGGGDGDLTLPLGLGVVGLGGGTVALAAIARRRRTWTGIEPTELDAMPAPRATLPAPAVSTDVWTPLVPRSPSKVPTNTMPVPR